MIAYDIIVLSHDILCIIVSILYRSCVMPSCGMPWLVK